jgi:hypothetical protein
VLCPAGAKTTERGSKGRLRAWRFGAQGGAMSVFKKTDAPEYMRLPDSRAGAMSCLTGIAIRNSIDQKRPIKIADLVRL